MAYLVIKVESADVFEALLGGGHWTTMVSCAERRCEIIYFTENHRGY